MAILSVQFFLVDVRQHIFNHQLFNRSSSNIQEVMQPHYEAVI